MEKNEMHMNIEEKLTQLTQKDKQALSEKLDELLTVQKDGSMREKKEASVSK